MSRTEGFRLGCLHGKINTKDQASEAKIQRTIFLSQRIKIWKTQNDAPIIRIFAYEVPIEIRGKRVDLMGYDKDKNLYLIELKKDLSVEKVEDAIEQLNKYAEIVTGIKKDIEREFEEAFFFPITFTSILKMIIAPREFYIGKKHQLLDKTIAYGYFRDRNIYKREPKDAINIHLEK